LWDIARDHISLDDNEILEIANFSLNEQELEVVFSNKDEM